MSTLAATIRPVPFTRGSDRDASAQDRLHLVEGGFINQSGMRFRIDVLADSQLTAIDPVLEKLPNAGRCHSESARKLGVRRFGYMSGAGAGQGRPQPWCAAKDLAEVLGRDMGPGDVRKRIGADSGNKGVLELRSRLQVANADLARASSQVDLVEVMRAE